MKSLMGETLVGVDEGEEEELLGSFIG